MRLLLEVGYTKLLFAKGAKVSELIEAVDNAQIVEEVGPWNARKFQVKQDAEIEVKLISDENIKLPEVKDKGLDLIIKLNEQKGEAESKVYTLEQEVKKLKKQIEALTPKEEEKEGGE